MGQRKLGWFLGNISFPYPLKRHLETCFTLTQILSPSRSVTQTGRSSPRVIVLSNTAHTCRGSNLGPVAYETRVLSCTLPATLSLLVWLPFSILSMQSSIYAATEGFLGVCIHCTSHRHNSCTIWSFFIAAEIPFLWLFLCSHHTQHWGTYCFFSHTLNEVSIFCSSNHILNPCACLQWIKKKMLHHETCQFQLTRVGFFPPDRYFGKWV